MSYLLDTNVVSETQRKHPDANVLKWLDVSDPNIVYLSALTIGEITKGFVKLPTGKRKAHIQSWLEDVRREFDGRILPITEQTFIIWGKMIAEFEKNGIVRPVLDSLLEATAIEHNLILVTRNTRNFQDSSATMLNPWEE